MAFLCRIRQKRLTYLCSQFKRSYFQISSPCLSDYVAQNKLPSSSNHWLSRGRSNEGFDNVRFFAAPVQHKKKEEVKTQKGPRLNEQIKSHMVRLVTDEGNEIVPVHVALERAKRLNHDLVEVDKKAKPIVCKIMDYHRERYQQQVRVKERSKSKAESSVRKGASKEVRFSPKIAQKDLQMKADMAKRLMERGYRVKCMVLDCMGVLGSEDGLGELINRLHALIEDVAYVESGPNVEKSQAYIVVRHIKFGPTKKGAKGAAKSADTASSKDSRSQSTGGPSGPIQHPADLDLRASEDSDSESDHDEIVSGGSDSQSTPKQDKMNWSLSDANGAGKNVFDFIDDLENVDTSSDQKKKPLLESVPPNVDFFPPQMPANSSENRYNRQDSTRRGVAEAERFMRPGPGRAQMPQAPSSADSSDNRYSRQGSTRRGPPGAEQYVQPGLDPKSFKLPPQREIPKQNPSTSDCIPSSPSYGIFSNPNASRPRNHGFEAVVRPGNGGGSPFGFAKAQGPATEPTNPDSPPTDSSIKNTNRWGLFSGEGSNANSSRIFQNQAKVEDEFACFGKILNAYGK